MEFLPRNEVPSLTQVLRDIKRAEHGLFNCLASIVHDVEFVNEFAAACPDLPVLPNLRCGAWYVPRHVDTCHFKSTDGHSRNLSFSTTRLNLNVACLAADKGGCIIVDATRRGKRFPDAFSKTLPIWAAVVNVAVDRLRISHTGANDNIVWSTSVFLPPWIPESEASRVQDKLDEWADELLRVCPDLDGLSQKLTKPLRCLWIAQDSHYAGHGESYRDMAFTPLFLLSASLPSGRQRRVLKVDADSDSEPLWIPYDYIPGAGDDEETWAHGLTANVFWAHWRQILAADAQGAEDLVARLMTKSRLCEDSVSVAGCASRRNHVPVPVARDAHHRPPIGGSVPFPGGKVTLGAPCVVPGTGIVLCLGRLSSDLTNHVTAVLDLRWASHEGDLVPLTRILQCSIPAGKKDKGALSRQLPSIISFVKPFIHGWHYSHQGTRLAVVGDIDGDAVACTAVALVASYFVLDPGTGVLQSRETDQPSPTISKMDVRRYLAVVSAVIPEARPTRTMLKQVFHYFYQLKHDV